MPMIHVGHHSRENERMELHHPLTLEGSGTFFFSKITEIRSNLLHQAGAGPDLEAVCYGTNEVLGGDSVALVHNVEIISPPGVPTISGVQPHSSVQVFQMRYLLVPMIDRYHSIICPLMFVFLSVSTRCLIKSKLKRQYAF